MDARYIPPLPVGIMVKQAREKIDLICLYQTVTKHSVTNVCPTSEHISPILHFRLRLDLTQNRSLDNKQVGENGMAQAIPLLLQLFSVPPQNDLKF